MVTSHTVTLSGLSANTTYHFKVSSTDAAGNTQSSSDQTFETSFFIASLPVWSAAVNNVLEGNSNARILFIGDSTTAGYDTLGGTNPDGLQANNKAESTPTKLAALFPDDLGGIASFTGNAASSNLNTYDNRMTFPDNDPYGWGFSGSVGGQVVGGYALETTTAHAGKRFVFTPGTAWDTAEVYYSSYPIGDSGNTGNILADTTSIGTINLYNSNNVFNKSTFTTTLGTHPFVTSMVGDGQYDLEGIILYDSSNPEITVLNAGWSGAKSTDVAGGTSPWATTKDGIAVYDPDLVVIDLGINDWVQGTSESDYKTAMQAIIDAAKNAGSDVLLVVPVPSNGYPSQTNFQDYIHDLATSNDVPVIDFMDLWGSWSQANTNGWMSDSLHPNATGYEQKAEDIFDVIW
jgi:lysophospholipase L1-like esterase